MINTEDDDQLSESLLKNLSLALLTDQKPSEPAILIPILLESIREKSKLLELNTPSKITTKIAELESIVFDDSLDLNETVFENSQMEANDSQVAQSESSWVAEEKTIPKGVIRGFKNRIGRGRGGPTKNVQTVDQPSPFEKDNDECGFNEDSLSKQNETTAIFTATKYDNSADTQATKTSDHSITYGGPEFGERLLPEKLSTGTITHSEDKIKRNENQETEKESQRGGGSSLGFRSRHINFSIQKTLKHLGTFSHELLGPPMGCGLNDRYFIVGNTKARASQPKALVFTHNGTFVKELKTDEEMDQPCAISSMPIGEGQSYTFVNDGKKIFKFDSDLSQDNSFDNTDFEVKLAELGGQSKRAHCLFLINNGVENVMVTIMKNYIVVFSLLGKFRYHLRLLWNYKKLEPDVS